MGRFDTRTIIVVITVLGVLSFALISPAQPKERTEIVIGASLPLTGSLAPHGRDLKWAYELAASRINANGGIFVKDIGKKLKVKLITLDNGTNTMKSLALVERLINLEKVDMLLGGAEPMSVIANCMVAEKRKTYYHTAFGFPVFAWKEKKFKWSTNLFVTLKDITAPPFELLKKASGQPLKKLALVAEDTFSGRGLLEALAKTARSHGIDVVLQLKLTVNSADYSQQVSKLREKGVDCMLVFASITDTETLVRHLKQSKVNVPFIYTWKGGWSGQFWKDLGKDAQYIIADGFWSMDYPFEGAKELGEEYLKTFKEYSITVGLSYALAQVLFQAIEKAGSVDGAKVRAAVISHQFDTVMGPLKYDENGHAGFPAVAAQWWDGKQMLVYPHNYTTRTVELAPPWDQR